MQSRRWLVVIFAAYALATLAVTLRHEPWRDEANSWLVARDLPLSEVVPWCHQAGTPFLWYAILLPFARAGLPYAALGIIHWVIALAAAAVFLWRSPFGLATKVLFLFSFYPFYEYAVVARSYALGIAITFVLLALHPVRERHLIAYAVLVALLFNVNAHSAGPAAALALVFFIETLRTRERSRWTALVIMAGGALLSLYQLHSPGYVVPPHVVAPPWYGAFPEAAALAFVPSWLNMLTRLWAVAVLIVVVVAARSSAAALSMGLVTWTALALIFTYLWIGGYRHYGLVMVSVIAVLWLVSDRQSLAYRGAIVMLELSLLASLAASVEFASSDWRANFSGSKEMGRYMRMHGLDAQEIAAHHPAQSESVLPYLRTRSFWYPALDQSGSLPWDRRLRVAQMMSNEAAAAAAVRHFAGRDGLFLSDGPLRDPSMYGMTFVYATREPLMPRNDWTKWSLDERYWLYRLRR